MNKISIHWDDGTQDQFYIETKGSEPQFIITSDPLDTSKKPERRKTLVFKSKEYNPSLPHESYLTIIQNRDMVVATFESQTSTYDNNKAGFNPK